MKSIARIALILIASSGTALNAAEPPGQLDLAAALEEFQLPESSRTARELIPNWMAPKKLVVMVDWPERTVWLQQAMPAGVAVVGVRSPAEFAPHLTDTDALVEVNCSAAMSDAPKLKWVHANSGGGDTCIGLAASIGRGEAILTNSQKVKNTALAEMGMGYVFAWPDPLMWASRTSASGSSAGAAVDPASGSRAPRCSSSAWAARAPRSRVWDTQWG